MELQKRIEEQAVVAYSLAVASGRDFAMKAVISGAYFLEVRAQLGRVRHSGEPSVNGRNQHSDNDGFLEWCDSHAVASRTAYRWMDAADRVARKALGLSLSETLGLAIESETVTVPISLALTAPASELPDAAREFRTAVVEFLKDRTLGDAVTDATAALDEGSRITRAAGGREANGHESPGNRNEWALFAGAALADCLAHIGAREGKRGGHWPQLSAGQRHQARQFLEKFVTGLTDDAILYLAETCQIALKARQKGEAPRPRELRAAVAAEKARITRAKNEPHRP